MCVCALESMFEQVSKGVEVGLEKKRIMTFFLWYQSLLSKLSKLMYNI